VQAGLGRLGVAEDRREVDAAARIGVDPRDAAALDISGGGDCATLLARARKTPVTRTSDTGLP
jgi:hypothetical protein